MRPLVPIAAFELGNVATSLLILRATTLLHHRGRSVAAATSLAVLIYAGHNLCAYGGGHWLDRAGPRVVFASGGVLYIAAYALFALPLHSWPILVGAFCSPAAASASPERHRGSGTPCGRDPRLLGDQRRGRTIGRADRTARRGEELMPFERILVAIDGSDCSNRALAKALEFAELTRAQVSTTCPIVVVK